MQLAELLGGKKDVVEEQRIAMRVIPQRSKVKAELIFRDGSKRFYRCKALTKNEAVPEILGFVDCMQKATGDTVAWRFYDEKDTYHLGSNLTKSYSRKSFKSRWNSLMNYFFDLED
ncbi:hypothetical protein D5E69_23010 (plasmid) [Rossellomorea marisflavi]|jgi:Family of unknown function (DUF6018)|uniref:DUF6018 family natural product bioysynthesis protein n=1 Tax=Rossellomorea marisflavi TaxID=189381 RepID=UPI00131754AD|nr:DUF6018 family natural product bioysynthesis protein [Rossellomorea marisflavi]QHA38706.1 hypothetical protein D5E69_23010 [Rossellomorea marisflavi]